MDGWEDVRSCIRVLLAAPTSGSPARARRRRAWPAAGGSTGSLGAAQGGPADPAQVLFDFGDLSITIDGPDTAVITDPTGRSLARTSLESPGRVRTVPLDQ